jgi:hypothetical protein
VAQVRSKVIVAAVLCVAAAVIVAGRKNVEPLIPEDYQSWNSTIDAPLRYPIPGHESGTRLIFINKTGEGVSVAMEEGRMSYDYPVGTKIVKEVYRNNREPDGHPDQVLLMLKAPENEMSRGGWVWVVKDPSTGEETVIDYEFCVDCHANANEPHPYGDRNEQNEFRDYAFFPYRK